MAVVNRHTRDFTHYDSEFHRMVNSIVDTASAISEIAKLMPRTGKRGRNLLRKSYNRRPRNKQKRARAEAVMTVAAYMGAIQIAKIKSTPAPKHPPGGIVRGGVARIEQGPGPELFITPNGQAVPLPRT